MLCFVSLGENALGYLIAIMSLADDYRMSCVQLLSPLRDDLLYCNKILQVRNLTLILLITAVCLGAITQTIEAATFRAVQSGSYTASSTWQNGNVPPSVIINDTIIINSNVNVVLDTNIILSTLSRLEVKGDASIVDGATPNYISLLQGSLKGYNASFQGVSLIDIDSLYSEIAISNYNGNIIVNELEVAGSIYDDLDIKVNKVLRLRAGGGYGFCKMHLNPNSRTTIIFSGGSLNYTLIDLTTPFNVRYEDPGYNINNTPELNSTGVTDIEIALGTPDFLFRYSDLIIRGKLMITSGNISINGSNLILGA